MDKKKSEMNRNLSCPAVNNTSASSEELKVLFTDPALKKSKMTDNVGKKKNNSNCSSPANVEAGATTVKVVNPSVNQAAHNLMTRRITIAGGFLDIALFSANCETLKFVLELGNFHIYYKHVLGLLITSMVLQLLVGLTLFLLGCQVFQKLSDETYTNILNQVIMGLVALITIVNIFISTFGPKGTVMARCLGAFAFPDSSSPIWMSYLNHTREYMASDDIH